MSGKSKAAVLAAMCLAAGSVPAGTATISGIYFEDRDSLACNSGTQCTVVFPVLPSSLNGKLLLVESINCLLNSTQAITRLALYITDEGQNPRRSQYLEPPAGTGLRTFARPVTLKVTGGPPRQLNLSFYSATSNFVEGTCNILGTISTE